MIFESTIIFMLILTVGGMIGWMLRCKFEDHEYTEIIDELIDTIKELEKELGRK